MAIKSLVGAEGFPLQDVQGGIMIDSSENSDKISIPPYDVGQDLYAASIEEMQAWTLLLTRDIDRLAMAIEKKQKERAAAESIFNKSS